MTIRFIVICIGLSFSVAQAGDWPQWRGPNRDGVSTETGLLKQWPPEGPPLLWEKADLGQGYSSVAVVGDMIYATGKIDANEFCTALDVNGTVRWQTDYGRAWKSDAHRHARCTPTACGDRLYLITGYGDISCLDRQKGAVLWKVKGPEVFQGAGHKLQGVAESPLIVDDKVIFTPGGEQTSVVALNRSTGNTVWKSLTQGGTSCFISPIQVPAGGRNVIVTGTTEALLGIYADTGELAWKHPGVNWSVTPVYESGRLYDGNDLLMIGESSRDVSVAWAHTTKAGMGHFVRLGSRIYGALTEEGKPCRLTCIDGQTGKILYENDTIRDASVTAAEGMLYVYEQNGGKVSLIRPGETSFQIAGSFRIRKGSGPHYAHPVISHGRLYIRHGDCLMTYDIKEARR